MTADEINKLADEAMRVAREYGLMRATDEEVETAIDNLACAALAFPPPSPDAAAREDSAMLNWLVRQLSDRDFREAGLSFRHGDRDIRKSIRSAMKANESGGSDA